MVKYIVCSTQLHGDHPLPEGCNNAFEYFFSVSISQIVLISFAIVVVIAVLMVIVLIIIRIRRGQGSLYSSMYGVWWFHFASAYAHILVAHTKTLCNAQLHMAQQPKNISTQERYRGNMMPSIINIPFKHFIVACLLHAGRTLFMKKWCLSHHSLVFSLGNIHSP